jgi:hypothetical protein
MIGTDEGNETIGADCHRSQKSATLREKVKRMAGCGLTLIFRLHRRRKIDDRD